MITSTIVPTSVVDSISSSSSCPSSSTCPSLVGSCCSSASSSSSSCCTPQADSVSQANLSCDTRKRRRIKKTSTSTSTSTTSTDDLSSLSSSSSTSSLSSLLSSSTSSSSSSQRQADRNKDGQREIRRRSNSHNHNNNDNDKYYYFNDARFQSMLYMSIGSAIHLASYEWIKSISMTFVTSTKYNSTYDDNNNYNNQQPPQSSITSSSNTNTTNNTAATSMMIWTPFVSLVLLWPMIRWIRQHYNSSRTALWISTVVYALFLLLCATLLYIINDDDDNDNKINDDDKLYYHHLLLRLLPRSTMIQQQIAQCTTWILHVVSNAFVPLLYTQHWSFLSSVATTINTNTNTTSDVANSINDNDDTNDDDDDGEEDKANDKTKATTGNNPIWSPSSSSSSSTVWVAPVAGLGSVASTVAGFCMPYMVHRIGLIGSLFVSAKVLFIGGIVANHAYRTAQQHGLLVEKDDEEEKENKSSLARPRNYSDDRNHGVYTANNNDDGSNNNNNNKPSQQGHSNVDRTSLSSSSSSVSGPSSSSSLLQSSIELLIRVPILARLCIEVLMYQCVSSIIHYLFLLNVQRTIQDDNQRATFTGRCYGWINACSGILQFIVIPLSVWYGNDNDGRNCISNHNNKDTTRSTVISTSQQQGQLRRLWLLMPTCMLICATLMIYDNNHNGDATTTPSTTNGLWLVTATFGLHKVLEYSVRGVAMEMLFSSLDHESRSLGKELIGLVVDRIGRSGTGILLSCMTSIVTTTTTSTEATSTAVLSKVFMQALSLSSLLWFVASLPLANYNYGKKKVGKSVKLHND